MSTHNYFLYQCINHGIKIHLITRHARNITHELQQRHIHSIFETINQLNFNDKKVIIFSNPMLYS